MNFKKKYQKINYKIRVHSLPNGLKPPFDESQQYLENTYRIYQFIIDSNLLWYIWMIDEYQQKWIEVDFENTKGEYEFHTIQINEGTYKKVECDEYNIILE